MFEVLIELLNKSLEWCQENPADALTIIDIVKRWVQEGGRKKDDKDEETPAPKQEVPSEEKQNEDRV
jgi:hypothetical protein